MGNVAWKLPPSEAELLEGAKTAKLREINAAYQSEMQTILATYPDAETLTWDKQEREARAWQADSAVATPYIDALVTGRGMGKAELVQRIIDKADAWISISGQATGKRQAIEDAVNDAQNQADLDAITW